MPKDDKFKIKFDEHGHILVDDKELQRRLLYLLHRDGELVVRLGADTQIHPLAYTPNPEPAPEPEPAPTPRPRLWWCPNAMCMCGALKIVDAKAFDQQWGSIGPDGFETTRPKG